MIKKRLLILMVLWTLSITSSTAGIFYVLVSADDGMETVDEIYNEFNNNNGPQTLLTIFNDYPPQSLEYSSFLRPDSPPQNPDTTAGRNYRRISITYPYPTDVTAVMAFLENSPLIENVGYEGILQPIYCNPESPFDNDSILIELAFLPYLNCQFPALNPQNLAQDFEIIDNTINLFRVGSGPTPPSTSICGIPEADLIPFELGSLSAGTYIINIFNVFEATEFPAPLNERYLMGQTNLVIRGTEATPVPTLSFWLFIALTMILGLMGLNRITKT